jgi:uncharacterized protein YeaO (DUF488 family)
MVTHLGIHGATSRADETKEKGVVRVRRVYDAPDPKDGTRFLVERLWPRGMKKESLKMDGWLKKVAPSDALRRWFGHEPAKWNEFCRRYWAELDARKETWYPILEVARRGPVTLLYSARDTEHNNAVALMAYLGKHLRACE